MIGSLIHLISHKQLYINIREKNKQTLNAPNKQLKDELLLQTVALSRQHKKKCLFQKVNIILYVLILCHSSLIQQKLLYSVWNIFLASASHLPH